MKKFTFLLLIIGFAFGLESSGQSNLSKMRKQLIYGPLDYSGFQKIKKGAMWSERSWTKTLFEGGSLPEGCDTLTIKVDYFGMFAPNENNGLDRNFIIFPAGSRFGEKNGKICYLYCGNALLTLRPVSEMKNMISGVEKGITILHDTVWAERSEKKIETGTTTGNHNVTDLGEKKASVSDLKVNESVTDLGKKNKLGAFIKKHWWKPIVAFVGEELIRRYAVPAIFPAKKSPHGTMSGGRAFEETQTTTGQKSTDSGGSGGGRGN